MHQVVGKDNKRDFHQPDRERPSEVGSRHHRESSRKAVFSSNITGTGLCNEPLSFIPLPSDRAPDHVCLFSMGQSAKCAGSLVLADSGKASALWGTRRAACTRALFPRRRPSRRACLCRHGGPTGGVGTPSLLPGLRSFRTCRGNFQVSPRQQAAGPLTPLPEVPPASPSPHLHKNTASGFLWGTSRVAHAIPPQHPPASLELRLIIP